MRFRPLEESKRGGRDRCNDVRSSSSGIIDHDVMAVAAVDADAVRVDSHHDTAALARTVAAIQNELVQVKGTNERLTHQMVTLNETVGRHQDVIAMLLKTTDASASSRRVHLYGEETESVGAAACCATGEVVLDTGDVVSTSLMDIKANDAQNMEMEAAAAINGIEDTTVTTRDSYEGEQEAVEPVMVIASKKKGKRNNKKRKKKTQLDCDNKTLDDIEAVSKKWITSLPSKRTFFPGINKLIAIGSLILLFGLLGQGYGSRSIKKISNTSASTAKDGEVQVVDAREKLRQLQSALPHINSRRMEAPSVSCEGSNPLECGCGSIYLADYRGTLNVTKSGYECQEWNMYDALTDSYVSPEAFPFAGLDDGRYCRNPVPEMDPKPWCFTDHPDNEVGWEYCEVPYCIAPPKSCDSSDMSTTSKGLQAACAYHQCVSADDESDYISDINFIAPAESEVRSDCLCSYELWDCEFGSQSCLWSKKASDIHECCASKLKEDDDLSRNNLLEASCECSIKPNCEKGNIEKCIEYAESCCADEDEECMCEYKSLACNKAFDKEILGVETNVYGVNSDLSPAKDYCKDAAETCCPVEDIGGCRCDFYEPLCFEYTGSEVCEEASTSCCRKNVHCNCDLYTHLVDTTSKWEDFIDTEELYCAQSSRFEPNILIEMESLQGIYYDLAGEHWTDNTGWTSNDTGHCDFHGVTCNWEGHVIELKLRSNNVTGALPVNLLTNFYRLQTLDLGNNKLSGSMAGWTWDNDLRLSDTTGFFKLRDLTYVDLSQNYLTGEVDVLFAPSLELANFSHNNLTSVNGFKSFKESHETLQIFDLSGNAIDQDVGDLLKNIPINLEQMVMSNNMIWGAMPESPQILRSLRRLSVGSNMLSGTLPDFSVSFPNLRILDLSNQKQEGNNGGFTGAIPGELANLRFLEELILARNQLEGSIPRILGNFEQLRVLDLSDNMLSKSIPGELGNLDLIEMLNLSSNNLTGQIPSKLSSLRNDASIQLGGNDLQVPAPLDLCFFPQFDLFVNSSICPPERNTLTEIYDGAKGDEWTVDSLWATTYSSQCDWFGVVCNEEQKVVNLDLHGNGLSGTLSESIGNLSFLQVLDLSDNDIKGSIPTEIGLLSNLTRLRLNHNEFIGDETNFGNLKHLRLIQIHGNRLTGSIPPLHLEFPNRSSFISDCGHPSEFEEPLGCEECTTCCNSQGDCYPQEKSPVQEAGFNSYRHFAAAFFGLLIALCCAFSFAVSAYGKYTKQQRNQRLSLVEMTEDERYALQTIGDDSVYQFFLGKSWTGWIITLGTIAAQIGILFIFVDGSERDLSDDKIDLAYTYRCPRDQDECDNTSDLNWRGWVAFVFLMIAHLSVDIINGVKVIALSGDPRHCLRSRFRFFLGGTLLICVTLFTMYVSTIYNEAIATNNTEIIMNSVIILFIDDVDEFMFNILMVISPEWVDTMTMDLPKGTVTDSGSVKEDDEMIQEQIAANPIRRSLFNPINSNNDANNTNSHDELEGIKKEVEILHRTMEMIMEQNADLKRRLALPEEDSSNRYSSKWLQD